MIKEFKVNKKEYLFLRHEIMLRTGWYQSFTKNATTTSISFWVGSFALLTFFLKESIDQKYLSVPMFVLLLPIFVMFPMSFKVYENYVNFCNIGAYLIRFHEKPINKNNGTYFSWETAHDALLIHFKDKEPKIFKLMHKSNNEMTYLSTISLFLFCVFSFLLLREIHSVFLLITHAVGFVIGMLATYVIYKRSSYKCLIELSNAAKEFWKEYARTMEASNSHIAS
ncbi:MAG: hypothetical protein LBH44_03135 [Treponema sp.]|nr:hypothetical protein [Treponema sp.]